MNFGQKYLGPNGSRKMVDELWTKNDRLFDVSSSMTSGENRIISGE